MFYSVGFDRGRAFSSVLTPILLLLSEPVTACLDKTACDERRNMASIQLWEVWKITHRWMVNSLA